MKLNALNQSNCRNVSCSSIKLLIKSLDWLILDCIVGLLSCTIYTNHLGGNLVQKNMSIKFEVVSLSSLYTRHGMITLNYIVYVIKLNWFVSYFGPGSSILWLLVHSVVLIVLQIRGITIKHLFIKGGVMIGLGFHILFSYLHVNKEVAWPSG